MVLESDQDVQLADLLEKIKEARDLFLGYPVSKDFDYSDCTSF